LCYGACAEVITDGGGEFQGAFADLLVRTLIDHRVTSASHPQSNGLSERCVKSIKACLQRFVDTNGNPQKWDEYLPWILMGYRCTPQESTKVSPYTVLFGCDPVIPPSIRERMSSPINFDDPDAIAASILARAQACHEACIMVGQNLLVAQHRDQLRYARLRSGGYLPSLVHFTVGQFVYIKDSADAMHRTARPDILRVQEVRPSGVLVLVGRDGHTIVENAINCAPCHLPIHTSDVTPLLDRPRLNHYCEKCNLIDDEHVMILCDSCNRGWHTYCLAPPLATVPTGDWICQDCILAGVDLHTLRTQRAAFQAIRDQRQAQRSGRLRNTQTLPFVHSLPAPKWPHGRPDPSLAKRTKSTKLLHQLSDGLSSLSTALDTVLAIQSYVPADALSILFDCIDLMHSPSIISLTEVHGSLPDLVRDLVRASSSCPLSKFNAISYPCNLRSYPSLLRLQKTHGCHILIASPTESFADTIIHQVSLIARHMASFLVPHSFMVNPPVNRFRRLSYLSHQHLLDIIPVPRSILPIPHVWICVFPSIKARKLLTGSTSWDHIVDHIGDYFGDY
jgi:hypothetical protein